MVFNVTVEERRVLSRCVRRSVLTGVVVVLVVQAAYGVRADDPGHTLLTSAADLYELALNGQGGQAVDQLAGMALAVGGWEPAPGDWLVFDAALAWSVRGSVQAVDQPPFECLDARLARFATGCTEDYTSHQQEVRLGRGAFVVRQADGSETPRQSVDDALSTLVEEVAHSWQEFLFESDGRCETRLHLTTYEDWLYWAHGWEYQAKRYVLSLDGSLLHLSAGERAEFLRAVCQTGGYANPTGHHVPPYGPPAGWPNPAGWPTSDPTPGEFAQFCRGG
jgi:hypothetical protein